LLSGTPTKEKAADARGGLLREIGAFGYLVLKDFTSILSMHRDAGQRFWPLCVKFTMGTGAAILGWMVDAR